MGKTFKDNGKESKNARQQEIENERLNKQMHNLREGNFNYDPDEEEEPRERRRYQ